MAAKTESLEKIPATIKELFYTVWEAVEDFDKFPPLVKVQALIILPIIWVGSVLSLIWHLLYKVKL